MSHFKSVRILYMEDDMGLANLFREKLIDIGYEVDIAANGEEGLLMYNSGSYDIVAVDNDMPIYNGLEVIKKLNEMKNPPSTIMITGMGSENLAVEAIKFGASDYIVKDIDGGYLTLFPLIIESVLDQQQLANDKRKAEEALKWEMEVNKTMAELAGALIRVESIEDISSFILEQAIHLSESKLGFVGYIDPETGYLIVPTLTKDILNVSKVPKKNIIFKKFSGLWGWVLKYKKPILSNDPENDPRYEGIPQGHISIENFLSVPVIIEKTLVGIISLANSKDPYSERDLKLLIRMSKLYALAIDRMRREKALHISEKRYREHVENIGDIVYVLDRERNFKFFNRAFQKYTLYSRDELEKMNFKDVSTPKSYRAIRDVLNRQIMGEEVGTFELELIGGDETTRIFEVREQLLFDGKEISEIHGIGRDISDRRKAEGETKESYKRLRDTLDRTVEALAMSVDSRDPYTAGHQKNVAVLAVAIAEMMGLPKEQVENIHLAGILHDIGKIRIPLEILTRPGNLLKAEIDLVKEHSKASYEILKSIPFNGPIAEIVLQHHERFDGTGYPGGLTGDDTILEAKIIAVADAVEAITNFRPYRPARGIDTAIDELKKFSGTQFDPVVAAATIKLLTKKGFDFKKNR